MYKEFKEVLDGVTKETADELGLDPASKVDAPAKTENNRPRLRRK